MDLNFPPPIQNDKKKAQESAGDTNDFFDLDDILLSSDDEIITKRLSNVSKITSPSISPASMSFNSKPSSINSFPKQTDSHKPFSFIDPALIKKETQAIPSSQSKLLVEHEKVSEAKPDKWKSNDGKENSLLILEAANRRQMLDKKSKSSVSFKQLIVR
jgi:hypothetical protein